ncbi:MAG TPA: GNAT family N-acetyltransferase [Devosia sp.]|nr:GNAT family N-acetyltransferase [Devosia sp.]
MGLTIRRAGPADVPGMSKVLTASIIELCAADHGGEPHAIAAWTRNKSEAGVAGMLSNPDLQLFVAESALGVVAVGAVTTDGMVSLNYVAPEARFAGISDAMLARLELALVELGHREGRLESTRTAQAFYLVRGWQADGPQASGRVVNGYPMRKLLRP